MAGASGYWDDAKQKYDMVAGQPRTRDELVWYDPAALMRRWPSIPR